MSIAMHPSRGATRSMWQVSWPENLRPCLRKFLKCISRFLGHGGRFAWNGIKVVVEQFGFVNGRRYSTRWILELLAEASELGLIRRVRHSAPGQPAVYEAVIPGHPGYRPVKVRRRGVRPRRLLAAWHASDEYRSPTPCTPLSQPEGPDRGLSPHDRVPWPTREVEGFQGVPG